jgi:hypothetical protein
MATLTDLQMLNAARKALANHRRLRPATTAEAVVIADDHRQQEDDLLYTAQQCFAMSTAIGGESELVKAGLQAKTLAVGARLQAESWDRVAARPEGDAYRETEAALMARVEYYTGLVARNN